MGTAGQAPYTFCTKVKDLAQMGFAKEESNAKDT